MLKSLWFRFILCCHYILWSSCGRWELSGCAKSIIFFLLAAHHWHKLVWQNISGHTWTEFWSNLNFLIHQILLGLDYEVQFQAYQQHFLKKSLWIRLNAQRRRKSHTLDVSGSVSWVVGVKSSTSSLSACFYPSCKTAAISFHPSLVFSLILLFRLDQPVLSGMEHSWAH